MNISKLRPLVLSMAAFAYSLCTFQVALADDTEIYVPKDLPADQQIRPNILFVLDSSGSMTETVANSGGKNRNQVMHEVVNGLIDNLKASSNVNIGFMRYGGAIANGYKWNNSNEHGGHVIYPISHLVSDQVATDMKNIVKKVNTSDWTPLLETYYEAYLYYTGQERYFSGNRNHQSSIDKKINDKTFKSPISHSCQKNHIIYITDGEPTQDLSANTLVNTLVKNKKYTTQCSTSKQGGCLTQLAAYMANEDMALQGSRTTKPFPDPTNRKQTITSHFVGFALDLKILKDAATAGGGQYFTSDNASGLTEALQAIVVDITSENSTFVAPSVAVSAYNNLGFRKELYYALFRPSEGTNWPGNVKKYKLKTRDNDGKKIDPVIVDRANNPAIDDESGFFKDSASSFWNVVTDGADISKGGAAKKLEGRTDRKIYTWHGDDRQAGSSDGSESLKVFSDTSKITNEMLGATSTSRTNIINWITKNTGRIGDVLHNEPRLVAYKTDEDLVRAETEDSKEELVMFFGSNEGFIHAINPKNGEELYSFIPKELLHIPGKYMADFKGYSNKAYGMDGLTSVWAEYGSTDPSTKSKTATKVNLYAGMRRGGSNYYALDVSDKNNPKLKWVIKGAYNLDEDDDEKVNEVTPGFERLGLTFSAPKLADINISGVKTKVLIFSGGYDKNHDELTYKLNGKTLNNIPKNDTLGNALYIVNADTGELLWRAVGNNDSGADLKLSAMTNSMPATPTLVDVNGDGLTDIIYASDLRGQIFRFDINNKSLATSKPEITGVRLAKLGGADALNNRRFFSSPDVALIRDRGQQPYFTVSIGSGFREAPLNQDTDDRFYMIRDPYVYGPRLATAAVVTENRLTDVSATLVGGDTAEIYANIDALEEQIKQLNYNVKSAQNAYENHKYDIGYTAAHNEYLVLYNQYNQLQKEIDALTNQPYGPYDPAQADTGKPYNKNYLTAHAVEAQVQSEFQSLMLATQQALSALQESGSAESQRLADLYAAMLNVQSTAELQASELIAQENFLLEGNLNPAWTPELIAKTQQMFPSVDFDSNFGDFSDSAAEFAAQIDQNRLSYQSSTPYQNRQALNAQQASVNATLSSLAAPGADTVGLLNDLAAQLDAMGIAPATGDISELLASDQAGKQQVLSDSAANYKTNNDLVALKTVEQAAVQTSMQAALIIADDLEAGGGFATYQAAVDAAYEAASNPDTGIYNIRVLINAEYAKLDLAEGTLSTAQQESLKTSDGFFLRLPRGEKVLSDSVSYRGTVLFNTFSPRGQTISTCGSDVGSGKIYALSLRDSKGVFTEVVEGVEQSVRSLVVKRSGIPPSPSIIITEDGAVVIVGTEIIDLDTKGDAIRPTHWREN